MRQAARRGLLTVMATGGVLASTAGYAYADAGAVGAAGNSPGVGSGNAAQVPVDVPVNVCGNTINVVGLLNPAYGNRCGNASHSHHRSGGGAMSTGGAHNSPGVGSGNAVLVPVDIPVNACGNTATVVGGGNGAFGNHCANHSTSTHTETPLPPGTGSGPGSGWGTGSGAGTPPPDNCPPPPPPPDNCPPPVHNHPQPPPPPQQHRASPPPMVSTVHTAPAAHRVLPPQAVLAATGGGDAAGMLVPAGAALLLGGSGLVFFRRSRRFGEF